VQASDTTRRTVDGPVGEIELFIDAPRSGPRGIAVIAHPQPLLGGTASHKVPQLLARTCRDLGWLAVRPNFRGVGGTAGTHGDGVGETDDLVAVVDALRAELPSAPLALVGFSFGAFVQGRVAARLAGEHRPVAHVVLAGFPVGTVDGGRTYDAGALPKGSVVIHGELDEHVPLSAVLSWARAHDQPVTVIPGADHFFNGKLGMLRLVVESELQRNAT